MLDAEKMSKSTGNFLTLYQAVELFGTDGKPGAIPMPPLAAHWPWLLPCHPCSSLILVAHAATRLCLADGGDGIDDANFELKNANAAVLRLHTELEWTTETLKALPDLRCGNMDSFVDRAFVNEINACVLKADACYEQLMHRDALTSGFFALQQARDRSVRPRLLARFPLPHLGI